jgi:hypothetical protein
MPCNTVFANASNTSYGLNCKSEGRTWPGLLLVESDATAAAGAATDRFTTGERFP